jgi:hypothetical protein
MHRCVEAWTILAEQAWRLPSHRSQALWDALVDSRRARPVALLLAVMRLGHAQASVDVQQTRGEAVMETTILTADPGMLVWCDVCEGAGTVLTAWEGVALCQPCLADAERTTLAGDCACVACLVHQHRQVAP